MAPVAVAVTPALRPWRGAGVAYLLLDEPVAEAVRSAAKTPKRQAGSPARRNAPPSVHASTALADRVSDRAVDHCVAASSMAPHAATATHRESAAPSSDRGSKVAVPAASEMPHAFGPEAMLFSPAWQELWDKMSKASPAPQAVWTYVELGQDLCGQASAERRTVLQELIGALGMPKGSHAFWPYSLPPENIPEIGMFLSGLMRFRPSVVLLLGDTCATDFSCLGSIPSSALQDSLCRGYRFVRLPDMDAIVQLSPSARTRLIAFIKTSLS